MKLELDKEELEIITALANDVRDVKADIDEPIDYTYLDGFCLADFVESYLSKRGITYKESCVERSILKFGHAEMHIDGHWGNDYRTLLIMIKGRGRLSHVTSFPKSDEEVSDYNKWKIKYDYLSTGKVVIFDDRMPHCFISETDFVNYAIVVMIHKDVVEKLLTE